MKSSNLTEPPKASYAKTSRLPNHSEALLLTVFSETNEHMRNAEQKQLTVTGAYFGIVAVVISLLPGGAITLLAARAESALLYLFMTIVGCCVFIYQAWCRVWKEHYLRVVCRIAKTWDLPDEMVPYWLREAPEISKSIAFKANVDNIIVYLTFTLNSSLIALIVYQALALLSLRNSIIAVVLLLSAYASFIVWAHFLMLNRRDALHA